MATRIRKKAAPRTPIQQRDVSRQPPRRFAAHQLESVVADILHRRRAQDATSGTFD